MLIPIVVEQTLFAIHTGQDTNRIAKDTERDFFMSGQEALEYGIVDKVITKREMASVGRDNQASPDHLSIHLPAGTPAHT